MDTKRLLEIVQDLKEWKGDVFKLAVIVAAEQKEFDASIAESYENFEVAEHIRNGTNASG